MIEKIVLSAILSLTPAERKTINNLQARLDKKGHDISQYFEDSRFEIYKFEKRKRFTNFSDTSQSWYMKIDSIEKCADFIKENYYWLKKAEKEFGPSPEHITSQLQLETNRGQYIGERPVLNSLISVYLERPDRRNEFYRYLIDFMDLVSDTADNIILPKDIFEIKGSWAGAHGIAQMMPSVLKKYGKISDFDGDGFFNPMNMPDAIGFMARYLADKSFGKNSSRAIQKYNLGHPFYSSSIGKHTKKLKEIMEKRSKIPPEKISVSTDSIKLPLNNIQINKLHSMNSTKLPLISSLPEKQPFVKRIILKHKKK